MQPRVSVAGLLRRFAPRNDEQALIAGLVRPARLAPPGLDLAVELHRHRHAVAVDGLAGLDADPAFRRAIFLDILALAALEADADAAAQRLHVEMLAARVVREAVGGR